MRGFAQCEDRLNECRKIRTPKLRHLSAFLMKSETSMCPTLGTVLCVEAEGQKL